MKCEQHCKLFNRDPKCVICASCNNQDNCTEDCAHYPPCQIDINDVQLREENINIIKVYSMCHRQVIMGFDGAVDINIPAVVSVMEILKIDDDDKEYILEQVIHLWRKMYEKIKQKKPQESWTRNIKQQKESFK